ncbi:unnamed protein product [Cunninghamella echinulata]
MSSIWFDGPINDAVQLLNDIILDNSLQEVLKDHVIIKLNHESDNAKLFGQLYPIHRVPMVYFIKQGIIKDFAIETTSAEEIMDKITTLLKTESTFGLSSSTTLNNTANNISSSSSPTLSSTPDSTPIISTTNNDDNIPLTTTHKDNAKEKEAKEKLKKQMELARQKREEKEKKDSKEREIKRRQDGKEALETRQQLENKQNKLYFEKIKKEKQADEEHRRKIKEQIARDREEKQSSLLKQKKQQQQPSSINNDVSSIPSPSPSPSREYDECYLNIRQTDGKNNRQKFKANDTLGDVRQWIDTNRTDGEQPYKLLSQFPTRHFSVGDEEKTLQQLNLLPSATIIMKSIKNVSNAYQPNQSGGVMDYAYSAGGLLYNAVSGVGTTLTGFVGGFFNGIPSDQPIQQQGQQSSSSSSSLFSNTSSPVHGQRLGGSSSSNNSNNGRFNTLRQSEFDDDENRKKRTYNGNSVNQE